MTSPSAASTARRTFIRHYAEMVVAMLLGMFVLGGVLVLVLGVFGVDVDSWSSDAPALLLIGMAFTMTVPMVAWMRYRGHGWTPALEMTAAMFVPSFVTVGLLWLDLVEDIDALLAIEHVAMLLAMPAVMLARYTEYAQRPPRVEPRTKVGAAAGTRGGKPTGQAGGAAEAAQAQALGTDDSPYHFPASTEGLVEARLPRVVELAHGDEFDLCIAPVAKQLGGAKVRMLAYNGSIPGPTLRVKEGSEIVVNVENRGDLETTVHWHGLRLDNRYDGTHETQPPIPVGGTFSVRCTFPDPGAYWYHPHIREDYGQEMGLYGNVLVEPANRDYWPPANREIALTLDDILLEDGNVAPFSRAETTHAAMGRFGDVLLIGGETDLSLGARLGEVVRFYLTNTANTRVFRVVLPGARMKLVGGDSGRVEHERFVDEAILAPSERVVVDVLFDRAGELTLEHQTPGRVYPMARIKVGEERAEPPLVAQFETLRTNADMVAERERIAPYLEAEPDKTLAFIAEMDVGTPEGETSYTCPMHPEVVADQPGHCPECGMKLLPAQLVSEAGGAHEHEHGHDGHDHADAGGIEWEDDMVEINRRTTPATTRWKLIDRDAGTENAAIDWRFRVGDQIKIRLLNEMAGDHPMHHPFHVHGAGRFLVLSRDGVVEESLVWKDTVLVRTGETVDILLDVSNPGRWMAHCHIAEHHESGMMFSFEVTE